ncbi:MAG: NrsF family protein [Methylovirgula sp.]
MKTEDLIRTLAADQTGPKTPLTLALVLGLLPGIALSILLYSVILGPRPHLLAMLPEPRILFKLIFPWALIACALPTALQLVRPGADLRASLTMFGLLALVLAAAVVTELVVVPQAHWGTSLMGHYARYCVLFVPMLAFGPLVGALIVLKRAAPTNPSLAGAGAGLLAAAIGAAIYATHCPDDSPLFFATWYGLATIIVVIMGSIAGSKLLRW